MVKHTIPYHTIPYTIHNIQYSTYSTVLSRTVSSEILDRIFLHSVVHGGTLFFYFLFFCNTDPSPWSIMAMRYSSAAVVSSWLLTGPIVYLPDGSGAIFDWWFQVLGYAGHCFFLLFFFFFFFFLQIPPVDHSNSRIISISVIAVTSQIISNQIKSIDPASVNRFVAFCAPIPGPCLFSIKSVSQSDPNFLFF